MQAPAISTLDLILAGVLCYAGWVGWRKGLLLELLATLGFLVAVLTGFMFCEIAGNALHAWLGIPMVAIKVVSVSLTTLLVFRLWLMVAKLASKSFRVTAIGFLDPIAGMLLGGLKVALTFTAVMWLSGLVWKAKVTQFSNGTVLVPVMLKVGHSCLEGLGRTAPLLQTWYKNWEGESSSILDQIINADNR
jgi:membrane protein required for colicin V production